MRLASRLGHFATSFNKEFNLTMLTVAAIAPPRWPSQLSGTTLANQHNYATVPTVLSYYTYYLMSWRC